LTDKIITMKNYILFIDHQACWGCKACEVACKQENRVPTGIKLIQVAEEGPDVRDGRLDFSYRVDLCRHCQAPPCAEVCPVEAITRREDGLVVLQAETCIGCGACIEACPYEAITFNPEEGKALKCNLCVHRVVRGLLPACADNICLAHAIVFGPADRVQREAGEKTWLKERMKEDRKGK
jgi:Fe-S-cluster-containing dehydrogenase component